MREFKENVNESSSSNLRVEARESGGIFFAFDARNEKEAQAYNQAISFVLARKGLSPTPHGSFAEGKGYQPGYQNWETWVITEEEARALIPEIEEEAKTILAAENEQV